MPGTKYETLRKAVARQMESGLNRLRESYRQELVRTCWNIGRVLINTAGITDDPSPRNAEIIKRLARDFKRPDSFFYDTAKFYRTYPKLPTSGLSWGHYAQICRIKDPAERRRLEAWAKREGINVKIFRAVACVRHETLPQLLSAQPAGPAVLDVTRGKLYHYRVRAGEKFRAPEGRIIIDMGFSVDREVKGDPGINFRSSRIVRAVKNGEDYSARISPYEDTRLYTYRAIPERIIDGDTLHARIDLGFRTWVTETLRLRGIDTAELTSALGRQARIFVQNALAGTTCIIVRTYKQEKYGRFLADIFYKKNEPSPEAILKDGTFLNQELINQGLAQPYDGGAK